MKHTTGIVFISGAGLNRFLWDELKEMMEHEHPVLIIDSLDDKDSAKSDSKQSLESYLKQTVKVIKNWKINNFIIVAHSVGGVVGLKLAREFKNELKGFVAISCVIPKNGQSFFSALPLYQRVLYSLLLRFIEVSYVKKIMKTGIFGDLEEKEAVRIIQAYTKGKKAFFNTSVKYEVPDTDRLYIKLINDRLMSSKVQDTMIDNFKATKIDTLEGGHFPMLSNTERLASVLHDFIYNAGTTQK